MKHRESGDSLRIWSPACEALALSKGHSASLEKRVSGEKEYLFVTKMIHTERSSTKSSTPNDAVYQFGETPGDSRG